MSKKENHNGSGFFKNIINKVKRIFTPTPKITHNNTESKPKPEPKHKSKPLKLTPTPHPQPTPVTPEDTYKYNKGYDTEVQQPHEDKPKQVTTQPTQKSPKPIQQIKKDIQQKREQLTPPEPETPHVETTSTDRSLFTTVTIEHYRAELKQFPNSAEPKLSGWLDSLIATHGEDAVAQMIQDATADGVELTSDIAYSKELATYVADLINYLPDMTDWAKADLLDEFETWDDLL